MKKSLKIILIFLIVLFSFFSINSLSVKATSDDTNQNEEVTTFTFAINDYYDLKLYYAYPATLNDEKVGLLVGFNLDEDVRNNMYSGDLDRLEVKVKYCKWGIHFGSRCLKSAWKTFNLNSDDTFTFGSLTINQIGKVDDLISTSKFKRKATNDFLGDEEITISTTPLIDDNLKPYFHTNKVKQYDNLVSKYEYYLVLDETFIPKAFVINGTYINVNGEKETFICPGEGCYIGGTPLSSKDKAIDKVLDLVIKIPYFISDNWVLIISIILLFLVGVWIGPLITIITGGVKMILKILDYIWITIVNCFIAIHNTWFWLFTKDDFKRRNKLKPYRRYN